jgi:RNA recognition motif-containing protein
MEDSAASAAIQALNGTELDGRVLNINEARPKEDRYSGGYNNNRSRNRNSW